MEIKSWSTGWILPVNGLRDVTKPNVTSAFSRTHVTILVSPHVRGQGYSRKRNCAYGHGTTELGSKRVTRLHHGLSPNRVGRCTPRWTMTNSAKDEDKRGNDEANDEPDGAETPGDDKQEAKDREAMESIGEEVAETERSAEKSGADWDASWNELNRARSGGVFSFPLNDADGDAESELERIDRRTEQLTSLWTNENGFLIGIVILFGILGFYIYVYQTGGIRH